MARLFHGFPKFGPLFLFVVKAVLFLWRRRPSRVPVGLGLFLFLVLELDRRLSNRRVSPERFKVSLFM